MTTAKEEPTKPLPDKGALSRIEEKLRTNPPATPEVQTPAPAPAPEVVKQFDAANMLNMGQQNAVIQGASEAYHAQFEWTLEQEKALIDAMHRCGNFNDLAKMVGRSKYAVRLKTREMMEERTHFKEARKLLLR